MSCGDVKKDSSDSRQIATTYETGDNMQDVAQEPALHVSRFKQNEPSGNPETSIKREDFCAEAGPPTEGTVPGDNSTIRTAQLTRRASQLSDFLEMEIALDPSREKERLALENYLGCVRQLLEGMIANDQSASKPALTPTNRKADQKITPEK
jgi:hypothetical protein